ncbi:hypothetical protein NQ318_005940 [Aromia moschata]|uniref:SERTA domain-containing protein n=1 Tax=Aromia moschata TaxID=1265417 RepID=A0AAV8YEN0_9CUCU|nr:hypothetical protein NQ318_005940 [Aromia moschata]
MDAESFFLGLFEDESALCHFVRTAGKEMKSPLATTDEYADIFGPLRTCPSGFSPPNNRPSTISAKYRQKEERRKVLNISINKLKKIKDPEASIYRSVLISNTKKRLQKEPCDKKIQKQQLNYPRCYDKDNYLNLKSKFLNNETMNATNLDEPHHIFHADEELHIDIDLDTKLAEEISGVAEDLQDLSNSVDEYFSNLTVAYKGETVSSATAENDRFASKKRPFDVGDDCDVQDIF